MTVTFTESQAVIITDKLNQARVASQGHTVSGAYVDVYNYVAGLLTKPDGTPVDGFNTADLRGAWFFL
jgi:hypothetical protein